MFMKKVFKLFFTLVIGLIPISNILGQPVNDDCAGAITLTPQGTSCVSATSGTTTGATQSQVSCTGTANDDVWYQFTATQAAHNVTVIGASGFDAVLQVFSGSCGSLTSIVCQDVTGSGGTEVATLTTLTPGQTYYVRVHHWFSSVATNTTFTICVTIPPPPPANDDCVNATTLTVNPDFACGTSTMGTTVAATQSTATAPSCSASGVDDDVWYKFTATGASHRITITGATNTTAAAVYSGACASLTQLSGACSSTLSGTLNLNLSGLTTGTTYHIRVYTTSSVSTIRSNFTICVGTPPPPPSNDECAGAITLIPQVAPCSSPTNGTTVGATQSIPAILCNGFTGNANDDVWFQFVATGPAHMVTVVGASSFDAVVDVRSGSCNGSNIACADATISGGTEIVNLSGLTIGSTYLVRVYHYGASTTTPTFTICVTSPAPPPSCPGGLGAGTVNIASLPYNGVGLTNCGNGNNLTSSNATICGSSSYYGGEDRTFIFTPTTSGSYDIILTTTSTWTGLMLYAGCPFLGEGGTCVANSQSSTGNKTITVNLTAGTTYYLVVDAFPTPNCHPSFNLSIAIAIPPCSAPNTPVVSSIGPNSATVNWDAVMGATSYDFTVGTGASCPTGTTGSTASTGVNITGLIPNTTYRFCVRTGSCGGGAASGYATVTFVTAPLPNDNCSGAINVSCNQTISGSTVGATSDASMGSCAAGTGGTPNLGVWYRLQGDGSQVTASLCNSAFDTKIHIYEGSSCGSLVCVASNDDSGFCSPTTRSNVVFNTNAGSTYYILVSGFGSATGAFSLQIGCVCGAPLGDPWTVSHLGSSSGEAIDNVCGGSIDITSSGSGSFSADGQSMASQTICGNDVVTVKVASINNSGHAGISFRESLDPGARKYSLGRNPGNGILREIRTTPNTNVNRQLITRPNHHWLRVVRQGNSFISYTSLNGASWLLHSTAVVPMASCLEVGLYVQSPNTTTNSTGVFSDLSFNALGLQINQETGLVAMDDEVKVFPNPSNGQFQLTLGNDWLGGDVIIQVVNIVGQVMQSQRLNDVRNNQISLQLDQLAAGTYLMQVTGHHGMAKTERLIIQ